MPNYLFAYLGGEMPATPEEGAKLMAKWEAWIGGLGDAMVNPGSSLKASKVVTAGGVSNDGGSTLTGFSLVKAGSLDAAIEIAKGCPHVSMGAIEVSELNEW